MLEEYLNDQNVVTKLLLDSIESEKTVQAYLFVCKYSVLSEKSVDSFPKNLVLFLRGKGNYFEYSREDINKLMTKFKEENNLHPVCMAGVHEDLKNMKKRIEKDYIDNIFYFDYWEDECCFHGWEWSKDNGIMKSQKYITDGIVNRYLEMYALILLGLGYNSFEEMEEKEYGNDN